MKHKNLFVFVVILTYLIQLVFLLPHVLRTNHTHTCPSIHTDFNIIIENQFLRLYYRMSNSNNNIYVDLILSLYRTDCTINARELNEVFFRDFLSDSILFIPLSSISSFLISYRQQHLRPAANDIVVDSRDCKYHFLSNCHVDQPR